MTINDLTGRGGKEIGEKCKCILPTIKGSEITWKKSVFRDQGEDVRRILTSAPERSAKLIVL